MFVIISFCDINLTSFYTHTPTFISLTHNDKDSFMLFHLRHESRHMKFDITFVQTINVHQYKAADILTCGLKKLQKNS